MFHLKFDAIVFPYILQTIDFEVRFCFQLKNGLNQ